MPDLTPRKHGDSCELVVELARTELSLREISTLRVGSTVRLPRAAREPLPVELDGCLVGSARVVERDGRLGVRLES